MKQITVLIIAIVLYNCNEIKPKSISCISISNLNEFVEKYGESTVLDSITQSTFADSLDMMNFWYSSAMLDSMWYLRDTKIDCSYASNNLMKIFCAYVICNGDYIKYYNDSNVYVMINSINNEIIYDYFTNTNDPKYKRVKQSSIDSIYIYYSNWIEKYYKYGYEYIKEKNILPVESKYIFRKYR